MGLRQDLERVGDSHGDGLIAEPLHRRVSGAACDLREALCVGNDHVAVLVEEAVRGEAMRDRRRDLDVGQTGSQGLSLDRPG